MMLMVRKAVRLWIGPSCVITDVRSGKNWVSQCTSRGLRAALRAKCSKTMPIATPPCRDA